MTLTSPTIGLKDICMMMSRAMSMPGAISTSASPSGSA